jgi:hypothetical protein
MVGWRIVMLLGHKAHMRKKGEAYKISLEYLKKSNYLGWLSIGGRLIMRHASK